VEGFRVRRVAWRRSKIAGFGVLGFSAQGFRFQVSGFGFRVGFGLLPGAGQRSPWPSPARQHARWLASAPAPPRLNAQTKRVQGSGVRVKRLGHRSQESGVRL
jgi:hypothetical protein